MRAVFGECRDEDGRELERFKSDTAIGRRPRRSRDSLPKKRSRSDTHISVSFRALRERGARGARANAVVWGWVSFLEFEKNRVGARWQMLGIEAVGQAQMIMAPGAQPGVWTRTDDDRKEAPVTCLLQMRGSVSFRSSRATRRKNDSSWRRHSFSSLEESSSSSNSNALPRSAREVRSFDLCLCARPPGDMVDAFTPGEDFSLVVKIDVWPDAQWTAPYDDGSLAVTVNRATAGAFPIQTERERERR